MAPSVAKVGASDSRSTRHNSSTARKTSPSAEAPPAEPNNDAHLAKAFKSDLTSIRGLITCTICDQLLYEPWTLGCGHTYCYGCLCSWFKQHQHRKTCPDCRTAVIVMPAPSFTIKQMIEIFITRIELLPADESVDQHRKNIEEERMAVDIDKTTEDGLFKGCFKPSNRVQRQWVEEDGVYVCSGCHHEHVLGERRCSHCNVLFDEYDINDESLDEMDDFDGDEPELYGMEVDDLDSDDDDIIHSLGLEMRRGHGNLYGHNGPMFRHMLEGQALRRHHGHNLDYDTEDDDDEDEDEDEDDTGSMRDFIASDSPARDLDPPGLVDRSSRAISENSHITVSSSVDPESYHGFVSSVEDEDDSEEEGIIARRGGNRNVTRIRLSTESSESTNDSDSDSDSDTSTSASHRSAISDQPGQGDSESEVNYQREGYMRHSPQEGSDDASEMSDSDTVQELDREDHLRTRESTSSTPRRSRPSSSTPSPYDYDVEHSDNETEQYDVDGDVEMSVSPDRSGASSPSDSDDSDGSSRRTSGFSSVDLGPAAVIDEEDEDSDVSIRPPVRRRGRPSRNMFPARAVHDDDDVTLTQLFTRPPSGRRTSPTFNSQAILDWHASMRSSPDQQSYRTASFQQPRRAEASAWLSRPSRNGINYGRLNRLARGRNFTG